MFAYSFKSFELEGLFTLGTLVRNFLLKSNEKEGWGEEKDGTGFLVVGIHVRVLEVFWVDIILGIGITCLPIVDVAGAEVVQKLFCAPGISGRGRGGNSVISIEAVLFSGVERGEEITLGWGISIFGWNQSSSVSTFGPHSWDDVLVVSNGRSWYSLVGACFGAR